MPFQWTHQANENLLVQILSLHDIKLNYTAIASALGPGVTSNAVQCHIYKIKIDSRAINRTPSSALKKKSPSKKRKLVRGRGRDENDSDENLMRQRVKRERGVTRELGSPGGIQEDDSDENLMRQRIKRERGVTRELGSPGLEGLNEFSNPGLSPSNFNGLNRLNELVKATNQAIKKEKGVTVKQELIEELEEGVKQEQEESEEERGFGRGDIRDILRWREKSLKGRKTPAWRGDTDTDEDEDSVFEIMREAARVEME
ncbi:Similar to AT hook motif protein [Aspergillus oryzae RIB40]; acc. no. XP_001817880 [Pyronema omphalodes CBS 100304]|uniref:Similar to AT hook motif protein [Aspergillus oryzae RIB40] acc. no. XP_001817880 n=1 Tax=Pyronema omphalodes (strain CBS 100304) TaxID=1076935 RepID=U4LUU0_PYROM|nr:Similar to AT hook motif protein [Aspergillus oryzae RIB40]; acc. no. XP_001817880 [Pyronema omphalodes CBS 100304]